MGERSGSTMPESPLPLLIGLLVDVSFSMRTSIQSRSPTLQTRIDAVREAIDELLLRADALFTAPPKANCPPKIFALGFGFGNPLSVLLGDQGGSVRDLFSIPEIGEPLVGLDQLVKHRASFKAHIEQIAPSMFGDTPLRKALETAAHRLTGALANRECADNPLLFIISDGLPTDASSYEILSIAERLKDQGVVIISCYVTNVNLSEPRKLSPRPDPGWSEAAQLMFECSSAIQPGSPFWSHLSEYGWQLQSGGRLFAQINHTEILSEFLSLLLSPAPPTAPDGVDLAKARNVFVSYARQDQLWLARVLTHLRPLERDGHIDVWSDQGLQPGYDWEAIIRKRLEAARVAILLLSADFLASDFIAKIELPAILHSAKCSGTRVLPVLIKPCRYKDDPNLTRFKGVNGAAPIVDLDEGRQEKVLVGLSEAVFAEAGSKRSSR